MTSNISKLVHRFMLESAYKEYIIQIKKLLAMKQFIKLIVDAPSVLLARLVLPRKAKMHYLPTLQETDTAFWPFRSE